MHSIRYIDRATGKEETEQVYCEGAIRLLYGKGFFSRTVGKFLLHTVAKWPLFSWLYGTLQAQACSKRKVAPFITRYGVDTSEFQDPPGSFRSFNDFFIRKLRPECRPIAPGSDSAIIPADGRYLFYPNITQFDLFQVKRQDFSLQTLLQNSDLSKKFINGSLVIGRLCPTDCHRFYFPTDCTPSPTHPINGKLFSVNPIAIRDNSWIFCANRRTVTTLETEQFGTIAFLEIGATNVGSIHQTFKPLQFHKKGSEKGYFSFGGSAILMLFEPNRILFSPDLLAQSKIEIKCLIGQPLGTAQ